MEKISDRFLLPLALVLILVVMIVMPYFMKQSKMEGYLEGYALTSLFYRCKGKLPHGLYIRQLAPILIKNRWRVDALSCGHVELAQESMGIKVEELEKLFIERFGQKKPLFKIY